MNSILIIIIINWSLIFMRIVVINKTKDFIINILLVLNIIFSLIFAIITLYGVVQKIILLNELGVIK